MTTDQLRIPLGFVLSLLKDIRMERPKITEKDNLRLLFVSAWFVEFFKAMRSHEPELAWPYTLIKEAIEEDTVKWVLKRMREANDEKVSLKRVSRTFIHERTSTA
jgi:replication fork protection complex subunit Tof1/Swi1